ncbi:MAG: FAD-dependent oxidoreductase, partial [Verrucomicrobiae bacterium]
CASVTQLEILPMPPLERAPDNPWPEWPKVYKMDYGQEEAAAIQGRDPRQYEITAKRFLTDDNGRLEAVEITDIRWEKDAQGRFVPRDIEGTLRVIPAQLVLLAMGFLGPEAPLLEALGVERDPRGNAGAEYEKYTTSIPNVFAAGDCRRGQSLVVWAINEGRGAARETDRFLMGSSQLP